MSVICEEPPSMTLPERIGDLSVSIHSYSRHLVSQIDVTKRETQTQVKPHSYLIFFSSRSSFLCLSLFFFFTFLSGVKYY
jgi:hypothetical protein